MKTQFDFIYWNDLKMKLRQLYPQLTDSDLLYRDGTEINEILRRIAFKLGKSKKEMNQIILDM